MHISDGILEPQWIVFWFIISAIFIALGLRMINKRIAADPSYLPRISLIGAVVFVISVWHIPVPVTGSSSHPVGTPLASIIIGPFATVVISAIALFFQAFIGHGGLTTIGANTFSMGVVGAFGGYFVYRILKNISPLWFSAGMAGLVGSILTYVTTALELALSLNPDNVFHFWKLYSMGFIPTQLPLSISEFAFTAYVIKYVFETRAEVLSGDGSRIDRFTKTALALMIIIASVIAAGAYFGYLKGGNMSGTDGSVESLAAPSAYVTGIGVRLMSRLGEPLGFVFVGITGGLVTGYFWTELRGKP
ncbi:MAG: energy-coupling factor ABC transporter permease [Candidatus Methanoperedens sp.]|nr:energy-coupling factor ABC transporter permease [Candidatus Methanoperedens sp.]MCZ7370577.1 energy-coupling factor ABC transporter permease [Candidatus Methanoperedens sp.]